MQIMQKSKGFTIIELLVVVAIIAVLTGIVLVNVTQYVNRGKNSSLKGNLSSAFTNSAVYFDNNTTYVGFGITAGWTDAEDAINSAGGTNTTAQENDTNWFACTNLLTTSLDPAGSAFCVDSTGTKKQSVLVCGTATCSGAVGTSGAGSPTCQ